jgi:hypothetical protein
MECVVESIVLKLPETLEMEFRWKIRFVLEKSKSSILNMTIKELKSVKSLRLSEDVSIRQTEKGNCHVVLYEYKYKD